MTERMSGLRSGRPSPLGRPWACFAAVLVAVAALWGLLVSDGREGSTLIYAMLVAALLAIGALGERWWTPVLGGAVLASPIISVLWEEPTPCGDPCIDESIFLFAGICGAAITAAGALSRWLIVRIAARRHRASL
ncbi:MAG: hypothetical protein WKF94_03610 [Solirubrobacteraceae bacterium]